MESVSVSSGLSHASREVPSAESEEGLIDSVLEGRHDAFGELVRPYLTPLTRYARAQTGSESEAEDLVQQAVLLALSHLRQFRREASFKTWLSAIASNELIHWRRGQAVARSRRIDDASAAHVPDPSSSPQAQCQQREEMDRLRQAVTRLPEKYRQMIQLRDLRELSVAETARSLSLSTAAVKTRHHRARKLLVRSLTGSRLRGLFPGFRRSQKLAVT
jgi:RNA polymerase sigma-70 factor (ECF subfamily)